MQKGFTLIELIVTISIITILSGIVLFSITQYIAKGKDSNISGNLAILIPAGEVYYNIGNSYKDFCDPTKNNIIKSTFSQMPSNVAGTCSITATNPTGACCIVEPDPFQAWVACARKFSDSGYAFCVDSRGMKKDTITNAQCAGIMTALIKQCP